MRVVQCEIDEETEKEKETKAEREREAERRRAEVSLTYRVSVSSPCLSPTDGCRVILRLSLSFARSDLRGVLMRV